MALIIPIVQKSKEVVLIDDDELVHMSWKREGKKVNIEVHAYLTIESFIKDASLYHPMTSIFIDSSLSGNLKGEIESKKINDLGFSELFLATGFSKEDINKPKWIKEIYGKSPSVITSIEIF